MPTRTPDPQIGDVFGRNNNLVVLSALPSRRGGKDKMFLVHCAVCAKDVELFGDGNFAITKHDLLKGNTPCGCAKSKGKWSKAQLEVKVRRECILKDCTLIAILDDKGMHSKLHLKCNRHNTEWKSTCVNDFLNKGSGCKSCQKELISRLFKYPDEKMSASFMASGKFKEGTEFTRISGNKWTYVCPSCSSDEYVKAGLCTGIFNSVTSRLQLGNLACRCSARFSWTKAQKEYRLQKELDYAPYVKFVSWVNGHKNNESRINLECTTHGVWDVTIESALRLGIHCPKCGQEAIGDKLRIPEEERVLQINKIISDEELPYKFLGWCDSYTGSRSRFRILCDKHGEWTPSVMDFIHAEHRCSGCADWGYQKHKEGSIYVFIADGRHSFVGYGISNAADRRLSEHKRNLNRAGFTIGTTQIFHCTGQQAWDIEQALKKNFPCNPQDIEGFRTEATYYEYYQDVVDFVDRWLFENT